MKENLFRREKPRPESARICDMNYSMHKAAVNLGRIPSAKCAEKYLPFIGLQSPKRFKPPDCMRLQGAADARRRVRRRTFVLQVPDNKADAVSCECLRKKHLRVTTNMVINFPITLIMGLTIGTDDQNAISANRILLDIIFPFGNLANPVGVVRYRRKPLCGGSRQPCYRLSVNVRACGRSAIGRCTVSPPLTRRHHHRLPSHQHPYH